MRTALFFIFMLLTGGAAAQVTYSGANVPPVFPMSYPKETPSAMFQNEFGQPIGIKSFRGKVLIVNIWSTNCSQCLLELPMLDRLQRELGGPRFQVVAISSGLEAVPVIRRLFEARRLTDLRVYTDPQAKYSKAAGVKGLPTTFLIDAAGYERGRIRGISDWTSPQIKAQIRLLINESDSNKAAAERARKLQKTPTPETTPTPEKKETDFGNWFKKN